MSDVSEPLAALRAAVERVDDLHGPADVPALGAVDPMEHAARFEDLHAALVAVLADIEHSEHSEHVDHREQAGQARYGERERA